MENSPGSGPSMIVTVRKFENVAGGDGGGDGQSEVDKLRDETMARLYRGNESLKNELLFNAETPSEVIHGLRYLESKLEDGNVPGELADHYGPGRVLEMMTDKMNALNLSLDELVRRKWIIQDPATKEYLPKKKKFGSLAISVDEVPVTDEIGGRKRIVGTETKYNFGTEKERKDLARAYERAINELEARVVVDSHVGIRIKLRDSLESLVETANHRASKLKVPHLIELFNLADPNEMDNDVENHVLGDKIEMASVLYLGMLASETKEGMQEFLKRPRVKELMELWKGQMTAEDFQKSLFGDVNSWKAITDRDLDTFRSEIRGPMTKHGNIPGRGLLTYEDETNFIEKVGNVVGSVEASWVAAAFLRATGVFASEGYVALPKNEKSFNLELGVAQFLSSDDTGKLLVNLWNKKEFSKKRSSGLQGLMSRIPNMAFSFFDWAQVDVGNGLLDENKRSIMDAWLGTPAGFKKSILTGEVTNIPLAEERGRPLREVKWNSLPRDAHANFTNMQWLAARQDTGVLDILMKTEVREEDFLLSNLKKMWKYFGIVFNPIVVAKGSAHKYDMTGWDKIPQHLFHNMLVARKKSASYALNVLPGTKKLFNPAKGAANSIENSTALILDLNIKTMDTAGNLDNIESGYLDKNESMRVDAEGIAFAEKALKVEYKAANGRITGKNVYF